MRKIPEFHKRLRDALQWAGYWRDDKNDPDVPNFAALNHWRDQDLRAYLDARKPRTPDYPAMKKLAADLGVPMVWLVCGNEALREIGLMGQLFQDLKAGKPFRGSVGMAERKRNQQANRAAR